MLIRKPVLLGRSMLLVTLRTFHFHFAYGFCTRTLAYRIDSLVRVSRRDSKNHFGKITVVPQAPHALTGLHLFWREELDFAQKLGKYSARLSHCTFYFFVSFTAYSSTISDLFTLFSKSFSSFLHSTCSLSVSHPYLALEELYLPLRAAVPSNPTLVDTTLLWHTMYGAITLCSQAFNPVDRVSVFRLSWLQFRRSLNEWFQFWALPGSVALTKGIFVNFFSSA